MKIWLSSTQTKITSILIVSFYTFFLLWLEYKENIYLESVPKLNTVSTQVKNLASTVTVGMHINSFPLFSFDKNHFTMDAIVWFKFPKAAEDISTLERFTIRDAILQPGGILIHKSLPIIKLVEDDVIVCYHILVQFVARLKAAYFPINDHRLNIFLENRSVTSHDLVFDTKPEYITISEDILVDDWKPISTTAVTGYVQNNLDPANSSITIEYPCAAFSIAFTSLGARNLIGLYFPLFVIFLIGLLSLFLEVFDITRFNIIATALPMLVLFRLVIETVSPTVGYTTHIDFFFYALVFISLFILLLQSYFLLKSKDAQALINDTEKQNLKNSLEKINLISFYIILIALIMLMTYNFF